jgi:D-alanyl-D-alanine carboxypeptidase
MLPSGNDAATTVAVAVGGSISGFVQMMNDKAASLGLSNTRYANPHGLHDADHYTTAADMAKLTAVALKNELFRTVVSSSSYKVEATNKHPDGFTIYNSNKLVSKRDVNKDYYYAYAIGVKTGYTNQALGCLVAAAQKDGQTFIAVMMGDDSAEGSQSMFKRFTDARTFFEYGFSMRRLDLFSKIKSTALSAVLPGEKAQTQLSAIVRVTSIVHWMDAVTAEQIVKDETKLDVSFDFTAAVASPKPTGANAVVGTVAYSYKGIVLYTCDVIRTPVVKPGASGSSALIVLASTILLSMAALLLVLIIFRRVTKTRSVHKSRYAASKRRGSKGSGSGKLRDPYDFRH